jgi:hypothetical protein
LRQGGFGKEARDAEDAIRAMLNTPEGSIFMQLLENCTIQTPGKILDDPRALSARHAQGFILLDLRRVLSNEREVLEQKAAAASSKRGSALGGRQRRTGA